MQKIFKNKKGKVFVMLEVLVILTSIIGLWAVIDAKQEEFLGFGEIQTNLINAVNKKEANLLYLDTAAQLAYKNTSQSKLAEKGGFENLDTSTGEFQNIGCGKHIYPMYTNSSGTNCFETVNPKKEYLEMFKENLYKYLGNNPFFASQNFELSIINNKIVGIATSYVDSSVLTDDDLDKISLMPPESILNKESKLRNGDEVAKTAKTLDPAQISGNGCAGYLVNLLTKTYQENNKLDLPLPTCISGDAWDIAACFLDTDLISEDNKNKRVVYAGPGLNYEQLNQEDLLKEGDLLFLSTKNTWCKWSGFNAQQLNTENYDEAISYCEGTNGRDALRDNPVDGFCKIDSFNTENYPNYCVYEEDNREYENFPIVTHVMLYVGDGKIAQKWGEKTVNQDLETFLTQKAHRFDGIRIIVRPNYK
jgi:hypothetical protein